MTVKFIIILGLLIYKSIRKSAHWYIGLSYFAWLVRNLYIDVQTLEYSCNCGNIGQSLIVTVFLLNRNYFTAIVAAKTD